MELEPQHYESLADIAKALERIADVFTSDYFETQVNTVAAGIDRISDALERLAYQVEHNIHV